MSDAAVRLIGIASLVAPLLPDAGPDGLGPPMGVINVELTQKVAMGWPEAFVWIVGFAAACFLISVWVRAMNGRL